MNLPKEKLPEGYKYTLHTYTDHKGRVHREWQVVPDYDKIDKWYIKEAIKKIIKTIKYTLEIMTILDFIKSLIGSIGDSASYTSKDTDEYGRPQPTSYGGSDTKLLQEDVEEMLKKGTSSKITLTDDVIKIENRDKKLKIFRK